VKLIYLNVIIIKRILIFITAPGKKSKGIIYVVYPIIEIRGDEKKKRNWSWNS
jgi:hypothetical protein